MDDCVVIDIETSGVNSSTSQIIGISAVLLKNGIVDGLKYECWCRCHNLEKAAADIIGKKAAFFEDQIPLAQAINNLNSFLDGHRLVAKSPSFCKDFLHKAGLSAEHDITDAIGLVRAYLKGFSPYDYEDFGWSDWLNGPLKNVMPCSYHLEDDFDATMIAKMIEIAKSGSLWAQLESADWYDD